MKASSKDNILHFLSSINTNNLRFDTKFAILSFHNQSYSNLTEFIILFLEYAQLASQAFLFNLILYEDSIPHENALIKGVTYGCKLLSPGRFLAHQSESTFQLVFLVVFGLLLLKYTLTAYICAITIKNIKQMGFFIALWRWIFKLHGRVIYFLASSFLLEVAISASKNEVLVFGLGETTIIAICLFIICIEYAFSLILQIRFCYVLPTKSMLSAKDCILEASTLTQKFSTQVLQLGFSSSLSTGYAWVIIIFNLIFSLARAFHLLKILPLYHLRALLYQGALIAIVIAMNLACLVQAIAETKINIYDVLIVTIIMSLLTVKIVHGILTNKILELIQSSKNISPKFLVHKVHVIKELIMPKTIMDSTEKIHWFDLVNETVMTNATKILSLDPSINFIEGNQSKEGIRRISMQYLEDLLNKFPNSDIVKLYTIYYYTKKLKMYGVALKMLNDLKQNSASRLLQLNTSLILHDIRNVNIFSSNNKENQLNLSQYLKNLSVVAQWKSFMLEQVDLQASLCEETTAEIPDLAKILTLAQKMNYYRHAVEKRSKIVFNTLPGYYIEPHIIYAHYQLLVNHSVSEYREYVRHHYKKYKQYDTSKYFKNNKMIPENLYQNTGLAILSAQKGSIGKVLFCSKNIENIFGGDLHRYLGNDSAIFGPPATRSFYTTYRKDFVDSKASNAGISAFRGFAQHYEGYIFELDYCMDIALFEKHGLCLCLVVRKVISDKDYLLVNENGEIEGASRKIGKRLGLFQKGAIIPKINIRAVSQELGRANEAFNIMAMMEKYKERDSNDRDSPRRRDTSNNQDLKVQSDIDFEEATNLHAIFSTEGKEIVIIASNDSEPPNLSSNEEYKYICNITTANYGTMQLKTFILEEIETDLEIARTPSPPAKKWAAKSKENGSVNLLQLGEKNLSSLNDKRRKSTEILNFEDERVDELIGLSPLKSDHQPRLLSLMTENKALTSIRTEEENFLPTSNRGFLSPRLPISRNVSSTVALNSKQKAYLNHGIVSESEEDSNLSENDKQIIIKPTQSISSQMSDVSRSNNALKAYRAALISSTAPKSFKLLCFCFYTLLIVVFASQLNMKDALDAFLKNLQLKKNILSHSATRDTTVANIHGNANSIWLAWMRFAGGENTAALNATILRFRTAAEEQLAKLDPSNNALLLDMQYLDEETSKIFFEKDVRIYETFFDNPKQVYMNYTNFGAVDRIIETGMRAMQKARNWNYAKAKDDFFFLFRNPENDLLIKSAELGRILDQALTNERESAQSLVTGYLVLSLVFLGLVSIALYILIWKQYLMERDHMLAFVKLDLESIRTVYDRLKEFKYKIENERSFEKTNIDLNEYLQPTLKGKKANMITLNKKHLQVANYNGIFKKYVIHTVKLTAFICVFIGLVLWSNISAKISIEFFHKKQVQLYLSGQMKFRTTIAAIVSEELLSRNNKSQIMNEWTANKSPSSLNDLATLRDDVTAVFLDDNPVIADILFGHGRCDLLPTAIKANCDTLKANGILLNYMSVLTNYEKYLRNRYEKFLLLTNRTTSALLALRSLNIALFLPMRQVLEYQSIAVFNLINTAFEADLKSVSEERNTIFAVIAVFLAILSVIAWFSLLRILKEANNQFKRVLQSLPAHIVLQSFLLRLFLMGHAANSLKFASNA